MMWLNVLEKLILEQKDLKHTNHKKQMDFSQNKSCPHAMFLVSEVAKHIKHTKSQQYIWL
jgi:hypothetical protein